MRHAFSLVELSIVLVILGLLTGGILAGQSLIRAAELRAVSTEFSRYVAATQTFRDKYMALPGDMLSATRFWGDNSTLCADAAIANGTPGTCNGNGDGSFAAASGAGAVGEIFLYWQQMALAGLIEGQYATVSGSLGSTDHDIGVNSAASRLASGGWGIYTWSVQSGSGSLFDGAYGANFVLGKDGGTNERPIASIVRPEEMWGIDTKMDDGKPATGNLVVRTRSSCTLTSAGAAMTTSVADAAKLDAIYNLASTSDACAFVFRNLF